MLVNAGLVGEGVRPHNGLVRLHIDPREGAQQPAGGVDLCRVHARDVPHRLPPRAQGHNHFLQRDVACPFPDAVDCALHLPGAGRYTRQGVGGGETQVVVAVDADGNAVHPRHTLAQ